MADFLLWLYLANSILLINHEIDSAYWKEWELFKLPGGITGFLLLHLPLLFFILYGLILLTRQSSVGLIFSLVLCAGGFFAFAIHMYFLGKGRSEFNKPISKCLLIAILVLSVIQLPVTLYVLNKQVSSQHSLKPFFMLVNSIMMKQMRNIAATIEIFT